MSLDGVKVYALGRNKDKLNNCFYQYLKSTNFSIIIQDHSLLLELNSIAFDYIFHAASPQSGRDIEMYPVDVIKPNLIGTINLLDLLVRQKVLYGYSGRLILFSSITIYSNTTCKDVIFTENDTYTTDPIESKISPYSQSKRMSEVISHAYIKQHNCDVVICRLSTIYGHTKFPADTAFFEFIKNANACKDIIINNNSLPKRDNLYLEDAIKGLIIAAKNGLTGETYNISSNGELGNYVAADEIAEVIAAEFNKIFQISNCYIRVIHKSTRNDERPPGISLDNTKLKGLGWFVETNLQLGISKTIQLYRTE
jgi:nucleoside-diphosphate-sugar epimerase